MPTLQAHGAIEGKKKYLGRPLYNSSKFKGTN